MSSTVEAKMNPVNKLILKAVVVAVILNIVLSMILKQFATPDQINPPNGAGKLGFFDQLMHMFVHHSQVPITSSIIIIIVVALSVFIANKINV